jgi:hypothetical protein
MKFKALFFFFLIIILFFHTSCNKNDTYTSVQYKVYSEIENKFFNSNESKENSVISAMNIIKRINDKHEIVEDIVTKIGYPIWNKALVFSNSSYRTETITEYDSVNIISIPFARDSQNYVNASLLFKMTSTDTSFQYILDWQYIDFGFTENPNEINAKDVFNLFMRHNFNVFNSKNFQVTDGRLLGYNLEEERTIIIDTNSLENGNVVSNILSPVTLCTPYIECNSCSQKGTESNSIIIVCCNPTFGEFCSTIWIEDGWNPVNGSGGSGSSGGGNGTSGTGWTPQTSPCGTITVNISDPCGTGWTILPDPNSDPINYVLTNLVINPPNIPVYELNNYLKCFTNTPGSVYKVTIQVDQPVPGQSDCWAWNNGIDVGHTFLTFEQIKPDGSKVIRSFGFYPENGTTPIIPQSPGMFSNDENEPVDVSLTLTITDPEFFMQKINVLRNLSTPTYHLSFFNCTTFATVVFNQFGASLQLQSCFWANNGNPGDLGQYIRNMQLGANQTRNLQTTTAVANAGLCQ